MFVHFIFLYASYVFSVDCLADSFYRLIVSVSAILRSHASSPVFSQFVGFFVAVPGRPGLTTPPWAKLLPQAPGCEGRKRSCSAYIDT